jgi:hypothetical protein
LWEKDIFIMENVSRTLKWAKGFLVVSVWVTAFIAFTALHGRVSNNGREMTLEVASRSPERIEHERAMQGRMRSLIHHSIVEEDQETRKLWSGDRMKVRTPLWDRIKGFSIFRSPTSTPAPTPTPTPAPTQEPTGVVSIERPLSTPNEAPLTSFSGQNPTPSPRITALTNRPTGCSGPLSSPPFPGKKGIGFTLREAGRPGSWVEHLPRVLALNVSWNYSWNSVRIPQQPENIEFLPMIWGAWGAAAVQRKIERDILPEYRAGRVQRFLGFNEPDHPNQSNMLVDSAVEFWPILEGAQIPLASPSVAHGTGEWMQTFMSRADNECLRMEYIGIHWYGGADAPTFKEKMREIFELYDGKRPLLITEFAPADWTATVPENNIYSQAQILAFMKEVLPWLEAQDWISGYAWFPFKPSFPAGSTSALFDEAGNLTKLGEYYATVSKSNPRGDQSISI